MGKSSMSCVKWFVILLTLVFIVLKLTLVIDWAWFGYCPQSGFMFYVAWYYLSLHLLLH